MGKINAEEVIATVAAIETALKKCKYEFDEGAGLTAAEDVMKEHIR